MRYFKTIDDTFDRVRDVLFDASGRLSPSQGFDVNYSSIATHLIQNVGRFAERFASDFLLDWSAVERLLETPQEKPCRFIVSFGIRGSGVDGNDYVVSRLRNTLDPMSRLVSVERAGYRKVFGLEIRFRADSEEESEVASVCLALKDLTHDLTDLAPEDIPSWNISQQEALKKGVLVSGREAIAEFLGRDYSEDEAFDVTDQCLDQRIEQMSRYELLQAAIRYGVNLPYCPQLTFC